MKHLYSPVKLAPKVREALLKAAHPPRPGPDISEGLPGVC